MEEEDRYIDFVPNQRITSDEWGLIMAKEMTNEMSFEEFLEGKWGASLDLRKASDYLIDKAVCAWDDCDHVRLLKVCAEHLRRKIERSSVKPILIKIFQDGREDYLEEDLNHFIYNEWDSIEIVDIKLQCNQAETGMLYVALVMYRDLKPWSPPEED